jgi:hypothetical protein
MLQPSDMAQIQLGDKVKDLLTGFEGIASSRTTFLHGIDQIGIQPPVDKDGKIPDPMSIDETSLEVTKKGKVKAAKKTDEKATKVKLGDTVLDPITGLVGVVTSTTRFINGCSRLGVTPGLDAKGKPQDTYYFAGPRLEKVVTAENPVKEHRKTGGPMTKALRY